MAGLFAKGTTLWMGANSSPESFVKVANARSFKGPNTQVTTVETTTHDTEGNFREFAAVLIDAGTVDMMVNFDPRTATHDFTSDDSLYGVMQNLEERWFELRMASSNPTAPVMRFQAFVVAHPFDFPTDNIQTVSVSIKLDGRILFRYGV
jgi:hypothetical protein